MNFWIRAILVTCATCALSCEAYEKISPKKVTSNNELLVRCARMGKSFFKGGNTIGLIGETGELFNQVLKELIHVTPTMLIDMRVKNDFSRNIRYIIIATDVDTLYSLFRTDSLYGASQYMILTTAKLNVLSDFATYLRRRDFFKVMYLCADYHGKLAFRQYDDSLQSPMKRKFNIFKTIIDCNANFSKTDYSLRTRISTRASRPIKYILPTTRTFDNHILKKHEMLHEDCRETSEKFMNLFSTSITPVAIQTTLNEHNQRSVTVRDCTELVVRGAVDATGRPLIEEMPREELNIVNYVSGDSLCFAIKLKSLDTAWNKLLLFVGLPNNFTVSLTIGLYVTFSYVTKQFHARGFVREHIKLFDLVSSVMSQPMRLPNKVGLRVVIGMWIWLWFIWNKRNNSAVTSSLAKNTFENLPTTMEDLDKSGFEFGGEIDYRVYLNGINDPVMDRLFKRYKVVSLENSTKEELLSRMFLVERCSYYDAYEVTHRFNASEKIFTLANNLLSFSITFVLKKGSPYYSQLDRVVLICQDTGLINKWENECSLSRMRSKTGEKGSAIILKLKHLHVAFVLLIAGYFISVLAFFIELCIKRE